MKHDRPILLQLALILGLLPLTGCPPQRDQNVSAAAPKQSDLPTFAQQRLPERLAAFAESFRQAVVARAEQIERDAPARQARQAALAWRTKLPAQVRELAYQDDPVEALLDLWSLCRRQLDFLTTGAGRELFGPMQPDALAVAEQVAAEIREVAQRYLPRDFDQLAERIVADAAERPLIGLFEDPPEQAAQLNWLKNVGNAIQAPLAPMRQINEGAQSIKKIEQVAAEAVEILEDLPASVRYQVELLLSKLEEFGAIKALLDGFAKLTDASERLTTTAENLPANLRKEVTQMVEDLDELQLELQNTLGQVHEIAQTLQPTVFETNKVAAEATRMAAAWEQTARAAQATVREVQTLVGRDPNGVATTQPSGGPSFDVRDYQATAQQLSVAATQMRELVGEMRAMLASGELETGLTQVNQQFARGLTSANAEARATIDHVAWRAAQLLGLVFALLLAYRLILWPVAARHRQEKRS